MVEGAPGCISERSTDNDQANGCQVVVVSDGQTKSSLGVTDLRQTGLALEWPEQSECYKRCPKMTVVEWMSLSGEQAKYP